jgi:heme A synthase
MTAGSTVNPTHKRTFSSATVSLIVGMVAFFGLPARPLLGLIFPKTSVGLFAATLGLQVLLGIGAVVLGLRSKPSAGGRRPTSAYAGITLGGLALTLCTVLAVALTFNYIGNSMDRSVIETDPIILLQD